MKIARAVQKRNSPSKSMSNLFSPCREDPRDSLFAPDALMFAATISSAVWPRATEGAPSTQASIMSGAALDSRATVRVGILFVISDPLHR